MKRTFHPRVGSGFDNRVERAAEGFNSLCLYLIPAVFFALILLADKPYKQHARVESHVSQIEADNDCYGMDCGTYAIILGQSVKEARQEIAKAKKTASLGELMDSLQVARAK